MPESTVDCAILHSYDGDMKRPALMTLFVVLVLVELYLGTGLLPKAWQYTINDVVNGAVRHISSPRYDYSVVTHPAIDQEIEQALQESIWLRLSLYAVFAGLLAGNTFAIVRLWCVLGRASESQAI